MRKLANFTFILLFMVVTVLLTAKTPTMTAGGTTTKTPTCIVPNGMLYNSPEGSTPEAYKWQLLIGRFFDCTPAGSTITISMFLWDDVESAKALMRADRRGVKVRMIMGDNATNSLVTEIATELNDGKTKGSWFKRCKGSCSGKTNTGSGRGIMHAKIIAFSAINTPFGVYSNTVTVGTGNPTVNNSLYSTNVWQVYTKNSTLYKGLVNYILKMKADKDLRTQNPVTIKSGSTTIYLYPIKSTADLQLSVLKATKAQKGCKVRGAYFTWTNARDDLAKQMSRLARGGCDVKVIVNYVNDLVTSDIVKILLRGGVEVRDARYGGSHTHAKDTYIYGTISGKKKQSVVITGSGNNTAAALRTNNEVMSKITGSANFKLYTNMWNVWSKRTTKVTADRAIVIRDGKSVVRIPVSKDPHLNEGTEQ